MLKLNLKMNFKSLQRPFFSVITCTIFSLFIIQVRSQVGLSNSLESVGGTVRRANRYVHTSLFAKLNSGQRPNFITNFQGDLIVSTRGAIYRININTREVSLLLNVNEAIKTVSGGDRELDFSNRQHDGLRSVAFHPRRSRYMYVSMMETRPSDPSNFEYLSNDPDAKVDSVVAEFKLTKDRKTVFVNSYRSVLRIGIPFASDRPQYDHPIKNIIFKGFQLYIAHGDASDQAASTGGGQNNDVFGKILRINPLKNTATGESYTIPSTNPFINDPDMPDEVFAMGFRNPHHLCFGWGNTLFAAETGRQTVEEVNVVRGGENFGWSRREGPFVFDLGTISSLPADDASFGFTYPAAAIGHLENNVAQAIAGGCPITNRSPMRGLYLYSDFPVLGYLYYSTVKFLVGARTTGPPEQLSRAATFQPYICFDQDNATSTRVNTLKDIIDMDPGFENSARADIRIGRGPNGVNYWSSKTNAGIYVLESTKVGGDMSRCDPSS